jgi:hypothetical protein
MSTLAEIEKAADALSQEEKERLILFLAARLRGEGVRTPPPRTRSRELIDAWMRTLVSPTPLAVTYYRFLDRSYH